MTSCKIRERIKRESSPPYLGYFKGNPEECDCAECLSGNWHPVDFDEQSNFERIIFSLVEEN